MADRSSTVGTNNEVTIVSNPETTVVATTPHFKTSNEASTQEIDQSVDDDDDDGLTPSPDMSHVSVVVVGDVTSPRPRVVDSSSRSSPDRLAVVEATHMAGPMSKGVPVDLSDISRSMSSASQASLDSKTSSFDRSSFNSGSVGGHVEETHRDRIKSGMTSPTSIVLEGTLKRLVHWQVECFYVGGLILGSTVTATDTDDHDEVYSEFIRNESNNHSVIAQHSNNGKTIQSPSRILNGETDSEEDDSGIQSKSELTPKRLQEDPIRTKKVSLQLDVTFCKGNSQSNILVTIHNTLREDNILFEKAHLMTQKSFTISPSTKKKKKNAKSSVFWGLKKNRLYWENVCDSFVCFQNT